MAAVAECLRNLAISLFADKQRNHRILCPWLSHPLSATTRQTGPSISWDEEERQRQESRRRKASALTSAKTKKQKAASSQPLLLAKPGAARAAATAAIGRRAVRQHTSSYAFAQSVSALHDVGAKSSEKQGPVAWMRDVFVALLTEPVQFTIVTNAGTGLFIHVFGAHGRCSHMIVPQTVLTLEELGWLQFLAMTAATWVDFDASARGAAAATEGHACQPPEHLQADAAGNDVFELALNRMALVCSVCEQVARFSETSPVIRQVLEAAVMATAAEQASVQAGYHKQLTALAVTIRHDQPRVSRLTEQQWYELRLWQTAYAVQHNVIFYNAVDFNALLIDDAESKRD